MSSTQRRAVQRHRKRLIERGVVRLEINVPKSDRDLLRTAATRLRAGGDAADRVRKALRAALSEGPAKRFKALLESAPLEGIDLERPPERWRDIDL